MRISPAPSRKIASGIVIAIGLAFAFQNCGGFTKLSPVTQSALTSNLSGSGAVPTATPTSTGTDRSSEFLTYLTLVETTLSNAGISFNAADLAAISPSALTNGTFSAANIAAAQADIIANLPSYISAMSSTEMTALTATLPTLLSTVQSYSASDLSASAQSYQATYVAILTALQADLASAMSSGGVGSTDQTAAFTATLASIDTQLSSLLSKAGLSPSLLDPLSAASLTAGSITSSGASAGVTALLSALNGKKSYLLLVSSSDKAAYITQINDAIAQLQAYDTSSLSPQAQIVQAANVSLLSGVKTFLGG